MPSLIEGVGNAGLLVGGHDLTSRAPIMDFSVDFWENGDALVFPERLENR